ncbi:MAG: hypothetical protein JJU46_03740 [Balneolaceae bacterium]|nr:hypothetical protein [Balneolaceae bacterium]MCH8549587.1 methylmalonyl-CoA mutase family protein [Balneolaceae bacterium]
MKPRQNNSLFSEFPPVSLREWEKQITSDLKGADYRKKLKWNTLEGVEPLPFYREDDLKNLPAAAASPASAGEWMRTEPIYESDIETISRNIQQGLESGMNSFRIKAGFQPDLKGLTGTELNSHDQFERIFPPAANRSYSVLFDSGQATPAILSFASKQQHLKGSLFRFDPLSDMARSGIQAFPDRSLRKIVPQLIEQKSFRTLCADGLFWHSAGATIVQEIAISLSVASEFILLGGDENTDQAVNSIWVQLSAGPLYFPEIAKIRAIRLLWRNLLNGYGLDPDTSLFIHSITSPQNKTLSDPHNNMLRNVTEAMAAVLGGTDSLEITPFDAGFSKPDNRSRRTARNIHHIVKEEAYLGRVTNPAAGSYYIEQLTDQIAKEAWDFFRQIEEKGGISEVIRSGWIREAVLQSAEEKASAYSKRKRILTGTNNYPDPEERISPPLDPNADKTPADISFSDGGMISDRLIQDILTEAENGEPLTKLSSHWLSKPESVCEPLPEFHAGSLFDSIRLKIQNIEKDSGRSFSAACIPIGHPKWRTARATFARNLIGCAGIEVSTPAGYGTLEDAFSDTDLANHDIFVLCSSDEEAIDFAPEFARKFRGHGILIQAGNPGSNREQFEKEGIGHFIYNGMDMRSFLNSLADLLIQKPEEA